MVNALARMDTIIIGMVRLVRHAVRCVMAALVGQQNSARDVQIYRM